MTHEFTLTQKVTVENREIIKGEWHCVKVTVGKSKPEYSLITQEQWDKSGRAKTFQASTYKTKKFTPDYLNGIDFESINKSSGNSGLFAKRVSNYTAQPCICSDEMINAFKSEAKFFNSKDSYIKLPKLFKSGLTKGYDLYFVCGYNHTIFDKNGKAIPKPMVDNIYWGNEDDTYNIDLINQAISDGVLFQIGEKYYVRGNGDGIKVGLTMSQDNYEKHLVRDIVNYVTFCQYLEDINPLFLKRNEKK